MLHFDTQAMPAAGQKIGPLPKNTDAASGESEDVNFADLVAEDETADTPEPEQGILEVDVMAGEDEIADPLASAESDASLEEQKIPVSDRAEVEHLQTMVFAQAPAYRMSGETRQAVVAELSQNGRVAINSGPVQTMRLPVQDDGMLHAVTQTNIQQPVVSEISLVRAPLAPETAIQSAFSSLALGLGKARDEARAVPLISPRSVETATATTIPTVPKAVMNQIMNAPAPLTTHEKQLMAPDLFGASPLEPESIASQQSSTQQTQQTLVSPTPLRVNAQPVAAQIAVALFQSKGATTEISLNPQELGKVRISMTSGDAGLVVNILAERPETTDLMRRHIDTLAKEFQDLGYQQMSFSFSEGDRQSDQESTETNTPSNIMIAPEADQPVQRAVALGTLDLKL